MSRVLNCLTTLLLSLAVTSPALAADRSPAAGAKTTTLLIMLDGFGARLLDPHRTPNLSRLAARGVASSMTPVWPSVSRPNHWALLTGLDARHSGVHHNDMYNPRTRRLIEVTDPNWGFGEPIWGTLAREGRISGVVGLWSGAQRRDGGGPTFHVPFSWLSHDGRDRRAAVTVELLDQLPTYRAELLALYVPDLDLVQHENGVGSPEANATLSRIDQLVGELVAGLADRKLLDTTNLVIVADHGQMNVVEENIVLSDYLDITALATPPVGKGPVAAVWPKPGEEDVIHAKLKDAHPHLKAYRAGAFPPEFRCCRTDRTPPIMLVADPGWVMTPTQEPRPKGPRGAHGFDPRIPEMQALFVAAGPDVRAGARMEPFGTVDLYSFLAALLKVEPQPSDGSIRPFCGVLVDTPKDCRAVVDARASLAADRDEPMVERITSDRILVTWSERGPVDVYVGTEPAASIESMRLVSDDDRDGRHELQLTDDRRPYFLLISERGKRRVAERLLPLEKGSNFRDVGGYPAANGRHVRWGSIYRSGATPVLSDRDIAYVRALGIGSMFDFRATEERQLAPTRLTGQGIRYIVVGYPFSKLTAEKPAGGSPYQRLLAAMTPQYRAVFDELLAHQAPVSYNCTAGQDRTGVATALILSALGVPRDIILEDYHLSTAYRRPENEMPQFDPADFPDNPLAAYSAKVRDSKPTPLYSADGRSPLASLFDAIDARWGSVDNYLAQVLGVGPAQLAKLQTLYLE